MALVEDLSVFSADFGVQAALAGVGVRVIFDDAGSQFSGISAQQPMVQLPTAAVPADYAGAVLTMAAGTFTVAEHLPDGTGWSTLVLQRTP